jgi:ubiquitin conjugation factor E4 B
MMMENPTKLPTSGVTMDLKYIKQMLLNDERDPINRAPLKVSDLIPDVQLKARIDIWKQ